MKPGSMRSLAVLLIFAAAHQLTAADITITTAVLPKIAGSTAGGGPYVSGTSATVTATATNDNNCYEFLDWTIAGIRKSTNSSYTFTATRNEVLVANFAEKEYIINTSSSPSNWGIALGGGKKFCGTDAVLTARAKPGYAFNGWYLEGALVGTTAVYKYPVSGDANLVAEFKDIAPPVVKILFPAKNEAIESAAFPIQGTATDNVAVEAVYYNLNDTGWIQANTFGTVGWYAWVTLIPNSANTVSVYAKDTSGNTNVAVSTKFICTAAGLAPLSVAGHEAQLIIGTDECSTNVASFDSASYVRISGCTNQGGEVGIYSYTPTGPDTADLVMDRYLPPQDTASNQTVLTLTFTNGFDATLTSVDGNGAMNLLLAPNIVPLSLDGGALVGTSFVNSNFISSNSFGSSTFEFGDSVGDGSSGSYTFTKFTPVGALVVETVTNPPPLESSTNFLVLTFSDATEGYYTYLNQTAVTKNGGADTGIFVFTPGSDSTKFLGPATLSGMETVISPNGAVPFIRTYGNGTFAAYSPKSPTEPTDFGINLANSRVSANTGTDRYFALSPPYILGQDDETVDVTFKNATSGTYTVAEDPERTGTITLAKLATNTPIALTGHTVTTVVPGKKPVKTVVTFTNNTFVTVGGTDTGTYTYVPYTPTMALVTVTILDGIDAGQTDYLILDFTTTIEGTFVYAQQIHPGDFEYSTGTFSFTLTK